MRFFYFIAALFLLLYGANFLLLIALHRPWWRKPWVRCTCKWLPAAALFFGVLWTLGGHLQLAWLRNLGAGTLAALFLYLLGLLLALLLTGPVHGIESLGDRARVYLFHQPEPDPRRRRFLRATLAGVPLLSSGAVTEGILSSHTPARLPQIPLHYPELPPALAGLKILHLSDIHIGPYVYLEGLEELLQRAAEREPDLVLVSGDICDDMRLYLDALKLIQALRPPLGTFASLGNHEYFRGIHAVYRHFSHSEIPLLVNEGLALPVADHTLYISGADDPRSMRSPAVGARLRHFVEASQQEAPSGAFRILMSHRSQAFDHAAPLGVELTLSGHTHGFQVGFGGRSAFESWMPERYIWGHYQKGEPQLYTSSGVGHWFPFRFGCPPEAPIFTLQST